MLVEANEVAAASDANGNSCKANVAALAETQREMARFH